MKKSPGFSLMEILVAVAIITIVMGIAIASSQGSRMVARDSQRKTELEQIRSALEVYRIDEGAYPATLDLLASDYLDEEAMIDPIDGTYSYAYVPSGGSYELCAFLETEGAEAGHCESALNGQCGKTGAAVACNYEVNQP